MTLDETIRQKLGNWHPPGGRHDLTVSDEGSAWAVTVSADRCDELGCLVWELSLCRAAGAPARRLDLRGWAQAVANRVTGLLEPLKVVEIDTVRNEGLLRSSAAAQRGDRLFYYEVLLRGTRGAVVRRYQANQAGAGPREQVAFALTHEALAKLAADLSADG